MSPEKSITFIVPALNEEKNLAATIDSIHKITASRVNDFEILIFDDGSSDNTGKIADELAGLHSEVRVTHNATNKGLGYNYQRGVGLAEKSYIMMVPGDNEINQEALIAVIDAIGRADVIIPYQGNQKDRPIVRQLLSYTFTFGLNLLFLLRLKYYNGPVVHKSEIIKRYPIKTASFAYQAEALVKILKDGYSYYQLPMTVTSPGRRSTAFRPKRIIALLVAILRLFWEIWIEKILLKNNPKLKPTARQFAKFCITGFINVIIDFSIYIALTRIFNLYFILANSGSFFVAVTSSFIINKKWTFRDSGKDQAKKYIKFIITNLIGLSINTVLLYSFVTYAHMLDIIAKILSIVITTFWNFNASRFWTFRKRD